MTPHFLPLKENSYPKIFGTLFYYRCDFDSITLPCLGSLGSAQTTPTEKTNAIVDHVLNYLSTHPNATVWYHVSGMILHVHSDAS